MWAGVLVVVLAVVAFAVWRTVGGTGGGDDTVVGADGEPVEVLARTDGFVLTGAVVTDEIDPATGEPGEPRSTFDAGEPVRFWLSFDDTGAEAGRDTLFVVFTHEGVDEPLFRAPFRLPQPTGQQNVTLGAGQTGEPGTYRVTVLVDDQELYRTSFDVR